MGTRMVSLRVDEELLGWATGYAAESGMSRTGVFELALRSLRVALDQGGVPEVPRLDAVAPGASAGVGKASRPVVPAPAGDVVRGVPAKSQHALAMARMRRMNPNRYGTGL